MSAEKAAWFFLPLLLFGITVFGVRQFISLAIARNIIDIPDTRSSHQQPTPRGAGIVIASVGLASMFFYSYWYQNLYPSPVWISACVISLVGYYDDAYTLSSLVRLVCQIAAAGLAVYGLGGIQALEFFGFVWKIPVISSICLPLLILVWSTNLFNFMDGIDGFAALEAMTLLGWQGLLLYWHQHALQAYGVWLMVPIVTGFLYWNRPRARVFMGDAGSYFLGFLTAVIACWSHQYGVSILFWGLLYVPFWFDATITLLRRIWKKKSWYQPHRQHAYQRLQNIGWSHQHILWGMCGINSLLSLLAGFSLYFPEMLAYALVVSIVLIASIYCHIETLTPMD